MNRSNRAPDGSFSFRVEFDISADSESSALAYLQQTLSKCKLFQYRIIGEAPSPQEPVAAAAIQPNLLEHQLRQFIEANRLIRLTINKGRGVKLNIPCRIINFDLQTDLLTVYHVDEKQVYTVSLNEIDDFLE